MRIRFAPSAINLGRVASFCRRRRAAIDSSGVRVIFEPLATACVQTHHTFSIYLHIFQIFLLFSSPSFFVSALPQHSITLGGVFVCVRALCAANCRGLPGHSIRSTVLLRGYGRDRTPLPSSPTAFTTLFPTFCTTQLLHCHAVEAGSK
ncbi:hypothetical protein L596_026685 [Steinernema carpocapsae]|uniref:Uncharacterized protein n=1 Tax=Steinernema carpocapsae TaxID=34508 RepID=A0A4U5M253_STECR|nr:hypothetical protein L596_026685 [Steinernema carpocapsae]